MNTRQTRRQMLKRVGGTGITASTLALAGCSGGGQGGGGQGGGGQGGGGQGGGGQGSNTYTMGVSSEGSLSYSIGGGQAQVLEQAGSEVRLRITSTSGVQESVRLMGRGDVPFANGTNDVLYAASQGIEPLGGFNSNPLEYTPYQVMCHSEVNTSYGTYEDRSITDLSVDSIEGMLLSTGPSGTTDIWRFPLDTALGDTNVSDIMETETTAYTDIPTGLRAGRIDLFPAYYATRRTLPGGLQELASDENLRIAPFTDEQIGRLEDSFYQVVDVDPANVWEVDVGVDPIQTATFAYQVVSASHTSSDLVYELVKDTVENSEAFRGVHPGTALFDEEYATSLFIEELPVHPGAAKYYQEVGVWDDSREIGEVDNNPAFSL